MKPSFKKPSFKKPSFATLNKTNPNPKVSQTFVFSKDIPVVFPDILEDDTQSIETDPDSPSTYESSWHHRAMLGDQITPK